MNLKTTRIPKLTGDQGEDEHFLSDTIERIADMHERMEDMENKISLIPEIKVILANQTTAQTLMAASAQSMADTFRKSEERQAGQEIRYDNLSQRAAGKDQMPISSHNRILLTTLLPTVIMAIGVVLYTLYFTNQKIEASFNHLAVSQQEGLDKLEKQITQKTKDIISNTDENAGGGKK